MPASAPRSPVGGGARVEAAQSSASDWQRTGRPARLIVVRSSQLDLVENGTLVARIGRPSGSLTMQWLAHEIVSRRGVARPSRWISHNSTGTIRLSAALLLSAGTSLEVGPATPRLLLMGGADPASASWIRAGRARLTFSGVSVTSWDPAAGRPVPPRHVGRPYVYVGAGGRLDVIDSTLSNLGRSGPSRDAGVTWGKGSTGSAADARFVGNHAGLQLAGSIGVKLARILVDHSVEDGLVLRADRGTTVAAIRTLHSGRDGVAVTGAVPNRRLAGVTTADSAGIGVKAVSQTGLALHDLTSTADRGGGVRLVHCVRCAISDLVAKDDTTAVSLGGLSQDVRLEDVRIGGSELGVRIHGKASRIALTDVTIGDSRNGVLVTGTATTVSLTDVVTAAISERGVSSASDGLQLSGGRISAGVTGIALRADADLVGVRVERAQTGIHVSHGVTASGTRIDVLALRTGVKVDPTGRFDLTDSRVRAQNAFVGAVHQHGHIVASLPPLPWFGIAGVVLLLCAAGFEAVHRVRQGGPAVTRAPSYVLNT